MRIAIFSDVHGNIEALNAVIEAARREGVRRYYCVGDVVGYGANPVECINRIKKIQAKSIAGNHDWAAIDKIDYSRFNDAARAAIEWTRDQLAENDKQWLSQLDLKVSTEDFTITHGALNNPHYFNYVEDIEDTADTFFLMETSICFIGHTHKPQVFVQKNNRTHICPSDHIDIEENAKYIVNVGSVGQPRDGDPKAALCIYDPDLNWIEIKRVPYDVDSTQSKILAAGLPEILARRLRAGQ